MYVIKHEYTVDGGFGDAVLTESTVGVVETEAEAKIYCTKWKNPHDYDMPYAYLSCGDLYYEEIPPIKDLNKPPHEYNESAAWAFDKNNDYYCDLCVEEGK